MRNHRATLAVLCASLVLLVPVTSAASSALAKSLLAIAVAHVPPGRSIYSAEVMPECGTDPEKAACPLARVCDRPSLLCAPPRWSKARNAWVRVESQEAGLRRYASDPGPRVSLSRDSAWAAIATA